MQSDFQNDGVTLTSAKDFSGQDLRGRSFKGQNLAGAKFIGADIRGADFTGANLSGADFSRARTGLRRTARVTYLLLAFILSAVISFLNMDIVAFFLKRWDGKTEDKLATLIFVMLFIAFYVINFRKGLEAGLRFALITFTVAVMVVAADATTVTVSGTDLGRGAGVVSSVGLGAVAGALAVAFAVAGALAGTVAGALAVAFALTGALAFAREGAGVFVFASLLTTIEFISNSVFVGLCTLANVYLHLRALRGDEKQAFILKASLALTRWGGTRFRNGNLTETNFRGATLQNADLRGVQLTRTRWTGAKKLLLARRNGTALEDYTVRALLESGTLTNKLLAGKNLKGAYLAGFDLSGVDFTEADLSEADLRGAKLTNANLTKVHAIGTLFQGADLTGACIEDWNIDHTTQLEGVVCRYVYMLNGQRERQPSYGEFGEGQFSALFEKVFDTVNLIFDKKGIDWQAFMQVFGQLQISYGEQGQEIAVQAIERKSDGTFVVKVKAPVEMDKAALQREFVEEYENKLAFLEAKYQAQLQAKNEVIAVYREQNARMDLIVHTLAQTTLSAKLAQKPVKILFLAANPKDTDRLRLDEEIREIDHALRQAKFRDKFDIAQHGAVRVAELQGLLLRHEPDVVHFSGHGSPKGEIVLEDGVAGESQTASLRALSRLFELLRDNIRCVILNACYTKPQAEEIAKHVPCVIGMSKAIGDAAAIQFASAFYQALGYGRNIRTAFALGCGQVDLVGLNEQDTPQLLSQNKLSEEMVLVKESLSNTESI